MKTLERASVPTFFFPGTDGRVETRPGNYFFAVLRSSWLNSLRHHEIRKSRVADRFELPRAAREAEAATDKGTKFATASTHYSPIPSGGAAALAWSRMTRRTRRRGRTTPAEPRCNTQDFKSSASSRPNMVSAPTLPTERRWLTRLMRSPDCRWSVSTAKHHAPTMRHAGGPGRRDV